MDTLNNQQNTVGMLCCFDYCETAYASNEGKIVNTYKCNQTPLSSINLWNINRQKKVVNFTVENLAIAPIPQV